MLTWAIAWMAVQMVKAGTVLDGEGIAILLFCSIVGDVVLTSVGLLVIFR